MAGASPLNVALIGAGGIASMHARILSKLPGVRRAAVCDIDLPRAQALARQYGFRHSHASIEEMAAAGGIDAVHILLPPQMHAEAAIACLRAGWHVLLEKPLCVTDQEAIAIDAAARAAGRHVGVNHNVVFTPALGRMTDELRGRIYGATEHAMVTFTTHFGPLLGPDHGQWMFAEAGNILFELGVHPVSVAIHLMGEARSAEVALGGKRILGRGQDFYGNWQISLSCARGTAQIYLGIGQDYSDCRVTLIGQDAVGAVDLLRDTYYSLGKRPSGDAVAALLDSAASGRDLIRQGFGNFFRYLAGYFGLKPVTERFNVTMTASIAGFYAALGRDGAYPADLAEGAKVVHACRLIADAGSRAAALRNRP